MVDGWADRGWERTCAHARRSSVIISDAIDILHDSVRSKLPVYSFPSIAAVSQSATVQCRCCCVGAAAAAFEGRPARRGLHGETLLLSGIDKGLLVLSSPLLSVHLSGLSSAPLQGGKLGDTYVLLLFGVDFILLLFKVLFKLF